RLLRLEPAGLGRTPFVFLLMLGILLFTAQFTLQAADKHAQAAISIKSINFLMPRMINDLTATQGAVDSEIVLTWTEPGAYGNSGLASSYQIKVSSLNNIENDSDFASAAPLSSVSASVIPTPQTAGSQATMSVIGLRNNTTYYFAIEAINADGLPSGWLRGGSNRINLDNSAKARDLPPTTPTGFAVTPWIGSIKLTWSTNPEGDIAGYRVYRSTANPPDAQSYTLVTSTRYIDASLSPAPTHFYRLTAIDLAGQESTATSWRGASSSTFVLSGTAVNESRILWTWDEIDNISGYRIYSSTGGSPLKTLPAGSASWIETGLSANTTTSRILKLFDEQGEGMASPTTLRSTLANPAANLIFTSLSDTSLTLAWDNNSNPPNTLFKAERSIDGFNYSEIGSLSTTTLTVTGLTPDTPYSFRIRSFNTDDIPSAYSNTISTRTLPSQDRVKPQRSHGLYGEASPDNNSFTLFWSAVTRDIDGSTETLAGYNIYRSSAIGTQFDLRTSTPVTQTSYTDLTMGTLYYYKVRAIDASSNEADDSLILGSNKLIHARDDQTKDSVSLPAATLAGNLNSYGQNLDIEIADKPAETNGLVYRSIEFSVMPADSRQPLTTFILPQEQAQIIMHYSVAAGQVARGALSANAAPMVNDGAINAGDAAENLGLYWFDGVKWVKLGGRVDTQQQTVSVTTMHFGHYQLRKVGRADHFKFDASGQSHKIFTPNNDGWNDAVIWRFENPEDAAVTGKIFDLNGAYVANLAAGPEDNSLMWDGKSGSANTMSSGVYIYQIEAGGTVYNGTVVIAR
ncbi:MAG: fibronectin type III domain-containing protein, partial [Elusimicrobiota bacterium]